MSEYRPKHAKHNPEDLLFSVTADDLKIETFRASGPGGQNVNKRETAVRIKHPASGAVGQSQDERTQLQNKVTALRRLAKDPRFLAWVEQKSKGMKTDKEIEQEVKESLADPKNIKTEVKQGKNWVERDPKDLT